MRADKRKTGFLLLLLLLPAPALAQPNIEPMSLLIQLLRFLRLVIENQSINDFIQFTSCSSCPVFARSVRLQVCYSRFCGKLGANPLLSDHRYFNCRLYVCILLILSNLSKVVCRFTSSMIFTALFCSSAGSALPHFSTLMLVGRWTI